MSIMIDKNTTVITQGITGATGAVYGIEQMGVFTPKSQNREALTAGQVGFVIAGIDMEKLQPQDLQMVNGVLNVRLPPAEVFVATLDNQKSHVYDRQTGLLTQGDQNLEATARQAAEAEIQKAALEDGILNLAQQNAETYLSKFFGALGFPNPVFVH